MRLVPRFRHRRPTAPARWLRAGRMHGQRSNNEPRCRPEEDYASALRKIISRLDNSARCKRCFSAIRPSPPRSGGRLRTDSELPKAFAISEAARYKARRDGATRGSCP